MGGERRVGIEEVLDAGGQGQIVDAGVGGRQVEGGPGIDIGIEARRHRAGGHLVAVLLNLRPDRAIKPTVRLSACGPVASQRALRYAGGPDGFTPAAVEVADGSLSTEALPPSSITVLDLHLEVKP